ncbi:MAG: DUF2306 domain-containing protein [Flavobacteriaceae bacterium]
MPHDFIGWFHTTTAIIALITGSMILAKTKGTSEHKKIGRIYAIAMVMVCATAFMIYRVHNAFGVLHFFALISTATLILGMRPMYLKNSKNRIVTHLAWMYWSVIGLYCAFAAEIFTRLPDILQIESNYRIFYALIGASSGLVGLIGNHYFKKYKKVWEERFG